MRFMDRVAVLVLREEPVIDIAAAAEDLSQIALLIHGRVESVPERLGEDSLRRRRAGKHESLL